MADVATLVAEIRRLTEVAASMAARGAGPDEIARRLLRLGGYPGAAIRAVAVVTGVGQDEAKAVVHRNLEPDVRAAAEGLWDELIEAAEATPEPPGDRGPAR